MLRVSPRPRNVEEEAERLEAKAQAHAELAGAMRYLREDENWQALRRSMMLAKAKVMEAHTRALMRGEALNQRQLDYDRGYWDGVAQMLEAPWSALKAYEETLERVENLVKRIEGREKGGDSTV